MLNWFRRHFGETAIDEALSIELEPEPALAPEPEPQQAQLGTVGDLLQALGLRVVHFRPDGNVWGSSRTTSVVYRPRQDRRHTIEISTAVCSERDPFDRKVGTRLALQRFLHHQTVHLPPNQTSQSDYELLQGIFG